MGKVKRNRKYDALMKDFVYANFLGHDIMVLSDLLVNMSVDANCPCCTAQLDRLKAMQHGLERELNKLAVKRCVASVKGK